MGWRAPVAPDKAGMWQPRTVSMKVTAPSLGPCPALMSFLCTVTRHILKLQHTACRVISPGAP